MMRLKSFVKNLAILIVALQVASVAQGALTPSDLQSSLEKNDDWHTITNLSGVKDLAERKSLAPVLINRLPKSSNPSKVAIIETLARWNIALSDADFGHLMADDSFEVRQAALQEFLVTRDQLSVDQQVTRFQKSFSSKPYQVRLDAMLAYSALDVAEQTKLKRAVGSTFKSECKAEKNVAVKSACNKILATQNTAVSK